MHRVLVIAAEQLTGRQLRDAIAEHVRGRDAQVKLVAPALVDSALEHAMGDVDEAIVAARERLARSVEELERAGIRVDGEVGDSDLRLAIQDALQTFDADEIVIVAHEDGGPYVERQGIAEAERDFEPPITEIFVERTDGGEPRIADIEHDAGGQHRADPEEAEPESRNLPPFSPRDLLGILVAIVGTIVLVVIAASGTGDDLGNDLSSQAAQILIAGAMALINLAHVIGLTLFQAGPYRGFGRTLFAQLSLWGTPLAIVACLLLA
jgi:hypothetical protein